MNPITTKLDPDPAAKVAEALYLLTGVQLDARHELFITNTVRVSAGGVHHHVVITTGPERVQDSTGLGAAELEVDIIMKEEPSGQHRAAAPGAHVHRAAP